MATNPWEIDWSQAPAESSASMTMNGIQIRGADPTRALDAEVKRGQITARAIDAARAPLESRKLSADAQRAELELANERAKAGRTADPRQAEIRSALENDEILSAIDRARGDITGGYSAGAWARLPEMVQPQSAINLGGSLNTITSRLTLDKLAQLKAASPTGASGLGSMTEREGALLRDSVAGLGQTQSPERLQENLAAVERHYRNYRALAAGEDPRVPEIASKYGIIQPSATAGTDTPEMATLATGGYRTETDPVLAGADSKVRSMIGAGRKTDDIVAYLNQIQPGLGREMGGDVAAAVAFRKQNPRTPLSSYKISLEKRQVPMTATRAIVNSAAQSAPGAYVMNAADTFSLGTLDNMTGNPAVARAGLGAVREQFPAASLLGTVTGGVMAGVGAEAGLARAGVGATAPWLADLAVGAGYGAGSADEGSRLGGAGIGAALGLGGGLLGRAGTRAVGGALTGVRDASVQRLRQAGVPMTIGQAVGRSGPIGRILKGREDRATGFSGIGDMINARRLDGIRGFNRAAFDEGLAPIRGTTGGVTGEQGVDLARTARSDAYSAALDPVRVQADAPFVGDMRGAIAQGQQLPADLSGRADYTFQRVGENFDQNGGLTGDGFQQSIRRLRRDAAGVRNQPNGYDFEEATRSAEGAFEGLLQRQSPGTLPAYNAANATNRNVEVLRDAVTRARNGTRVGEPGLFAPSQLADAASSNARRFGNTNGTTQQPFFDLTRSGQQVLPSSIPDSGTAGRAASGSVVKSLRDAIRSALNGPLYAEQTQPALNALLLDRPDLAVRLGERVGGSSRAVGMLGRPAALSLPSWGQ